MGRDAQSAIGGVGLRSDMTPAEMVTRFARLNDLTLAQSAGEFDGPLSTTPTLRARAVSARLVEELQVLEGVTSRCFADAVFDRWLRAHAAVSHRGVAWERVSTLGRYSQLVLTLAATMRVGTRAALVRLDHDVSRVARALEAEGCAGAFADFHEGARAFAHPGSPRVQAGVHLRPPGDWRWAERERFSRMLHRHGLHARSGLAEDQCRLDGAAPLVVWNPRLVALPFGLPPVTAGELRVTARP